MTMKKNLLFLLMAVFASTFIGCSDDDDPMIPPTDLTATFGGDTENKLVINYSDSPISGKQVKFETKDSKTASITLIDVIPGKTEAVIDNIKLTEAEGEYIFTGSSTVTRATDYTVAYSGSIKKGELTLNLNVTMPDPKKWAKTYTLADYELGTITMGEDKMENMVVASALHSKWEIEDEWGNIVFPMLARTIGGLVVPQVLKSVTLQSDGNITAEYSSGSIALDPSILMGLVFGGPAPTEDYVKSLIPTSGWLTSPKDLAYWFEKDDKLYVKLNVPAIVAQAMSDNNSEGNETLANIISNVLDGDAATIKNLLTQFTGLDFSQISNASFEMLLSWVKNGIPLNVASTDNGHTHIYLDKTAFDPIFTDREFSPDDKEFGTKSDLIKLWGLLLEAKIIPSDAAIAIVLLAPIPQNWHNTTGFELGLDLK